MMSLAGQKRPAAQRSNPGPSRSVNDYETEEQLRRALMEVDVSLDDDCTPIMLEIAEGQPVQKVCLVMGRSCISVLWLEGGPAVAAMHANYYAFPRFPSPFTIHAQRSLELEKKRATTWSKPSIGCCPTLTPPRRIRRTWQTK